VLGSRRPARAPRRVAERCAVGDAGLPPAPTGAVLAWERAVCIRPAAAPRARRGAGGLVVVLSVILKHLKKLFCVFLYLIRADRAAVQSRVAIQCYGWRSRGRHAKELSLVERPEAKLLAKRRGLVELALG